jgi:hypothetical protein
MTKYISVFFLIISAVVFGQQSSSSPYSYHHLGLRKYQNTIENKSMGELNVYADSIHLNLVNPASLSKLALTNYTVGATQNFTTLSTNSGEGETQRTTFDYIAVGLPIAKKLGVSFGISPFTNVGYDFIQIQTLNNISVITNNTGDGNINKVFLSTGYEVYKNLSVGLSFQYYFGRLTHSFVKSNFTTSLDFISGANEENIASINGINAQIGLYHFTKLNKKLTLHSSLTFSPKAELDNEFSRTISISTTQILTPQISQRKIDLPAMFNVGFAIGEEKKWLIGTEFTTQNAVENGNRFTNINNSSFERANKFNVGGYFIPQYNSFSSYWSRVTYRAGMRYENLGLMVNDQSINDFGITFGLGIPLRRYSDAFANFSNINIGFEYGRRGTKNSNLIQEDYFNISLSLSFNDKWFQRRKYN